MPELPEVETIKEEIGPAVLGHRIKEVVLHWAGIVRRPFPEEFQSYLPGKQIVTISRRGKYLILHLDGGNKALIFHLKMSGSLLVRPATDEPPKYTRAALYLDNGTVIFFRDPRKFGRMWLVDNADEVVGGLGPEPLTPEFTVATLTNILAKRETPVKAVIIDQTRLAGVGNMYADEALFTARIHPSRPAGSLSKTEIKRLHDAIKEVLEAGIVHKGASIVNYYRPDGSEGTAHDHFRVAHRRGETCPVCGGPIERIVVRGRGTYFCPRCQTVPGKNR